MQLEQLHIIASKLQEELPATLTRDLRDVELVLANNVDEARAALCLLLNEGNDPEIRSQINSDVPAACKGVFLGEPREVEEGDDEEGDENVTLPEGMIVLVAENIADAVEASTVLLHEVGHALGLDEKGVEALGLGAPPQDDPKAPPS